MTNKLVSGFELSKRLDLTYEMNTAKICSYANYICGVRTDARDRCFAAVFAWHLFYIKKENWATIIYLSLSLSLSTSWGMCINVDCYIGDLDPVYNFKRRSFPNLPTALQPYTYTITPLHLYTPTPPSPG